MPMYEYICQSCQHEFEELVFDTDATVLCPECSSAKTQKLMSCSCFKSADGQGGYTMPASAGGGCAGCSGGSCATCK